MLAIMMIDLIMEMSLLLTHKSLFLLQMCPYVWFWQVGNARGYRVARAICLLLRKDGGYALSVYPHITIIIAGWPLHCRHAYP